jgi:adenine/guanine phosphoribosyltransferase-like PRPP-binding protein
VETGSQARAVRHLVEGQGGVWAGVSTVVDMTSDETRVDLAPYAALLRYDELGEPG